ncbi:MAG: hydrogenase maturation protease [Candidatus Lokiarchaeota archaeon]|nr:hydrogenase maturation protease [Candidatus Lokiarchaeota archaeon]
MDWQNFEADMLGKLRGTRRLAVIGIGADLREDDAVGSLLARELVDEIEAIERPGGGTVHEHSVDEYVKAGGLLVLNASVVPEQYITLVKDFAPDTIVIVDAASMGEQAGPGDLAFVRTDELDASTFSTHTISLRYFIEILSVLGVDARILIVGIQPERIGYGEDLSPQVAGTKVFLKSLLLRYLEQTFFDA